MVSSPGPAGEEQAEDLQEFGALEVLRNFEVIGEAAKRLPDAFREKHPSVPWSLLAGFRDVLIHQYDGVQYDGVDLQRVWIIATRDRPAVKRGVAAILPSLDQIEREIAGEK